MTANKPFLFLLRSFACLICLSAALHSTNVFAQDIVHVVQPGENLFRIALNYGLTTDVLARTNGISDTSQIYAGQALIIPSTTPGADDSSVVVNPLIAGTPTAHTIPRGKISPALTSSTA